MGFELHPETPPEGMSLPDHLPGVDVSRMYDAIAARAQEFGFVIKPAPRMPNTRAALYAAEYARDHGRFEELHSLLFNAYFSDSADIGDLDVLRTLAAQAGLEPEGMTEAVTSGRYHPRLQQAREEARLLGLTGIPLFLFMPPDHSQPLKVSGARPLEDFRSLLSRLCGRPVH